MAEKKAVVTVIVPVYNTLDYLEECLESLVNQTYKNIEILLINDGSTDRSGELCKLWAKKDRRIRYICKENEGLGPTRNLGIKEARGEYVICVDSDDWVDAQFVEKLYYAISEADADIAECDILREVLDSGVKTIIRSSDMVGRVMSKSERIIYGNVSMCKMMTRTGFWQENQIEQPSLTSEDLAVYAFIIACSKKIVSVNAPLYHYRKGRIGSISSSIETTKKIIRAMQFLLDRFKENDIFKYWDLELCRYLLRWSSRVLVTIINKVSLEDYQEIKGQFICVLNENFTNFSPTKMLVLGGYNLTKIVQKTYALENPYARFCFQSIASIMGKKQDNIRIPCHKNPYREFMLRREFSRDFTTYLSIEKPDYIVLDFLEERHNLLRLGDEIYTYSDALQGSDFVQHGELLLIHAEETWEIWQEACLRFIALLKEYFKVSHVVLVENLLAERHGNLQGTCEFENIVEIRETNAWLLKCYAFFKENMPGIQTVNLTDHELYFTDDNYEYGCYPWHLNILVNREIGERIILKE